MLLLPMAAFLGFSVAPHMPAAAVAQRPAFGRPSMAAPLAISIQAGGLGLDAMNSSSVAVIKKSAVYRDRRGRRRLLLHHAAVCRGSRRRLRRHHDTLRETLRRRGAVQNR